MYVSGFTFVRNALKYDYPVTEAIRSILPLCDEVVVAVGHSEDGTLDLIRSIDSDKIRIIETVWDDSLREGGQVLAVETNKAFDAINPQADWAFYIQGDECVHEQYLPEIKAAMTKWKDSPGIDGLLFNYTHFYGSYDYVADSRKWYRREIRVIRNNKHIRSYRDAQGFRMDNDEKLRVKPLQAHIYHYGWVKHPKQQMEKQKNFHRMWHNDDWVKKHVAQTDEFDYTGIESVKLFKGSHPVVISERIRQKNWKLNIDPTQKKYSLKLRLLHLVEQLTGWRPGEYKNFRVV